MSWHPTPAAPDKVQFLSVATVGPNMFGDPIYGSLVATCSGHSNEWRKPEFGVPGDYLTLLFEIFFILERFPFLQSSSNFPSNYAGVMDYCAAEKRCTDRVASQQVERVQLSAGVGDRWTPLYSLSLSPSLSRSRFLDHQRLSLSISRSPASPLCCSISRSSSPSLAIVASLSFFRFGKMTLNSETQEYRDNNTPMRTTTPAAPAKQHLSTAKTVDSQSVLKRYARSLLLLSVV
ncbi:hypothetical protein ACLOJK_000418 [Asimina triloba]